MILSWLICSHKTYDLVSKLRTYVENMENMFFTETYITRVKLTLNWVEKLTLTQNELRYKSIKNQLSPYLLYIVVLCIFVNLILEMMLRD